MVQPNSREYYANQLNGKDTIIPIDSILLCVFLPGKAYRHYSTTLEKAYSLYQ